MEHKIGEIFQYNDEGDVVTLQVVLDNDPIKQKCDKCFFHDPVRKNCYKEGTIMGWCVGRNDGNPVKYIQINDTEEKRDIQISLKEAREWYNSGDSFKKELALKAYSKEELELNYSSILHELHDNTIRKNALKSDMYLKLINVASYVNSMSLKEPYNENDCYHYVLSAHKDIYHHSVYYKNIFIKKHICSYPEAYLVTFNSEEAAKQAIDILGDELKILFE